jgi:hypothetical protein
MHLQNHKFVVILPRENILFIPGNSARNVSTRSHLWILVEVIPVPIILYVKMNQFKGGLMDSASGLCHFNSENWDGMHKHMRY